MDRWHIPHTNMVAYLWIFFDSIYDFFDDVISNIFVHGRMWIISHHPIGYQGKFGSFTCYHWLGQFAAAIIKYELNHGLYERLSSESRRFFQSNNK